MTKYLPVGTALLQGLALTAAMLLLTQALADERSAAGDAGEIEVTVTRFAAAPI